MRLSLSVICLVVRCKLYNAYMKYIAYARGVSTALVLYRTGSRSHTELNGINPCQWCCMLCASGRYAQQLLLPVASVVIVRLRAVHVGV